MIDINVVVANNIVKLMKEKHTKQIELANAINVAPQTMSKMLKGSRMINIAELHKIADYFDVHMDDLMVAPAPTENVNENVVMAFMGKVNTDAARDALKIVDDLADMIIYHANIRENAKQMSEPWEM